MSVRLAEEWEAIEILSEPDTIRRTGKIPEHTVFQPWICEDVDSKMLFFFWSTGQPRVYEFHVAAPKKDIGASRKLSLELMEWLFTHGAKKLVSNCPEGKIANLARKVGMRVYARNDQTVFVEVESWELERQLLDQR